MNISKNDFRLYVMLLLTLVVPILLGIFMQKFSSWRFVSIPLHSSIESAGAMIAFILSAIIYMMYKHKLYINHFHRASFALISMGIFDAFHSVVYPGELFVWLHSLAIFFGGILFSLVWLPNTKVSKKVYSFIPIGVLLFSIAISVLSITYPSSVPQMLDAKKEFTDTANLLNMIGGVMFVIASLHFIRKYLEDGETDDLLFAGHTMLFGSAGVLFFFSALWDMQWWFWHTLRLVAYIVSLYFMLRVFYKNMIALEHSNKTILADHDKLTNTVKLLKEYKSAIYEGSIISTSDKNGQITYVNDSLLQMTGYSKKELIGKPHNIFRDPSTPKSVFKEMWETIQSKQTFKGLIKNRKKDGTVFYVKITVVPIVDASGNIYEYLALRDDVTELVKSQKELKKYFFTDTLTNLNNRFKLKEDLKELSESHIALLNIDNFKNINDVYGQEFGDKILIELSDILLNSSFKLKYNLYRNHGDEFAIVALEGDYKDFTKNIREIGIYVDNCKLNVMDEEIGITLSIGVSKASNEILRADLALKEAKNSKKSLVHYKDDLEVQKVFETNMLWSKKIKQALLDDRIEIVLQALYSNVKEEVVKYEALVRLIETDGEVISPFQFLDVSKRTRLYGQITRRVVKKVFHILTLVDKEISINICAEDIFDDETRVYLLNMLKESENSHRLVVELVESEGIENFSIIKEFLDEIKLYGVKLAIDDFGTGYSNFEYLLKLKADYIKIDGSMIKNIATDVNSFNVTETIVSFAKKNGMQTIAEFVSTKEIQEKIEELGIEYSQGYYIAKPKFYKELV